MRGRLIFAILPGLILLWLAAGVYLLREFHAGLDGAARDSRDLSSAFARNIHRAIQGIDTSLRTARMARSQQPGPFDLAGWERDAGLNLALVLRISFADRSGAIVATDQDDTVESHASIADRTEFRGARNSLGDELFIGQPFLDQQSGRLSLRFARKLFGPDGGFDGVIVATLDTASLSRFCAPMDVHNGTVLLLGADAIVGSGAAESSAGTMDMTGPDDGVERVMSWRRLEPSGLIVAVGLDRDDALVEYRRVRRNCLFAGGAVTILIFGACIALARNRRDLLLSREILRAAVDNISQGLLVVDAQRRVPVLNTRAAELLGLPPHLARPGVEFDSILEWQLEAGEFASQDDKPTRQLAESGGLQRGSSVYNRTRRNGIVLEVRTKVLQTGLAVRTFTDITEQQRTARVLADARDAAEIAARARSDFLAVMSHEIRTPLNGVIGVAELLDDMELGPAQRDYVRLIRQSGDHLLELVNDILDFSRLEADRVELEAVGFDPEALVLGVTAMFQSQARSKGLLLTAAFTGGPPVRMTGDPGRLRQILLNLLSNAVKFTDQGSVRLTLTREALDDGRVRLEFRVDDTGIGIKPEAIECMFHEFTQVDGSISRRFGGSGLGLAICRRLVELMGGRIGVDSQPGIGSTFFFDVTLSLAEPVAAEPVEAEPETQGSLRILVAEDNPTNSLVALRLLQRLGHKADAAANGIEAIEALSRGTYDLILMDVMMPEMDGLTATRLIRESEQPANRIAIVGLTAGSGGDALAACLEAGMDSVTTKPVTLDRLRAAIADGRRAMPAVPSPGMTPRLRDLAEVLGEQAVTEIVQTFREDTRALLAAMQEAADQGVTTTIYRCAHSIAGAARSIGADALGDRAAALEQNIGSLGPEQIMAEIKAMRHEFEAVLQTTWQPAG